MAYADELTSKLEVLTFDKVCVEYTIGKHLPNKIEVVDLDPVSKANYSSPAIQENKVTSVQCLSGTGSLRVAGKFLARHYHECTGFASGSLDADAQSVHIFVADGGECLAAQSYAKNMGLYGEHVGALSIVCKTADATSKVESQLKLVIRPMYSSPPPHGASIVAAILKDSDLYTEWTLELKAMADRIISMRQELFDALQAKGKATLRHF
ncbi:hypothetical protein POM88_042537 [Heracleum sosnowskyi]|uniref:Aminotransferase class I/classII large domain-containing protein n=1 Tax=Heracleum sosnowskyi TaxID=360622 RepID=A0AAD8MAR5_9APIA|nr:hypothetical protein POM88_042537 [Heracleum sosnowskyi]